MELKSDFYNDYILRKRGSGRCKSGISVPSRNIEPCTVRWLDSQYHVTDAAIWAPGGKEGGGTLPAFVLLHRARDKFDDSTLQKGNTR